MSQDATAPDGLPHLLSCSEPVSGGQRVSLSLGLLQGQTALGDEGWEQGEAGVCCAREH